MPEATIPVSADHSTTPVMPAIASSGDGLRRSLSTLDLTLIGFGSIFGSGWLFAASRVAGLAGPAGTLSWIIGGVAVLLLGLVYCELGTALPHAGGVVRYPAYTHGPLLGSLTGFITLIAFSSLIAIEIVAARQYASAWFPTLNTTAGTSPSLSGWLLQLALLCGCFALNYRGMKTFALVNNIVTLFKFLVPTLVVVLLLGHLRAANFSIGGFMPFGGSGVEAAVSTGGVIFAYLGLTPIVSVASEVRSPQRAIPVALIASVLLSSLVYVLLQLAFVGAVPSRFLARGWAGMGDVFGLPYRDIALLLGLGWLATLVVIDAVVSPTGTGNIYMSATPRIVYGWSRSGTFLRIFGRADPGSGVPRPALWLTLLLSVFWTLPFPSWDKLIGVVSSALMLSYALAPVSTAALRRGAPGLTRPFRVGALPAIGPAAFVVATLIVYWSGWRTDSWLLGLQLLMAIVYAACWRYMEKPPQSFMREFHSAAWYLGYCALMLTISALGSFGGSNVIGHPADLICVVAVALATYRWGEISGTYARMLQPGFSTPAGPTST